jgi:UDP-glucose 4-epimerase
VLALTLGRSPSQHYIHEEDLGEALYLALKKELPGAYNVGADDAVPAAWAFKRAGVRVIRLPSALLKAVMNIAFALHLLPASQGWVSLSEYTIFPNSNRFKKAAGWEPKYSSAETFMAYLGARTRRPDTKTQAILSWIFKSGARTRPTMAVLNVFRLGKIPWLRDRIPWMNPQKNSMSYLPINKSLGGAVEQVLPPQIVHDFIDKANIHVIMDTCGCRLARECTHYTPTVGCLFMGETALKLPHGISRRVSREQAHAHVDRAVEVGLVPMTGKVRVDNFIFLTPDESKLLSVCFCCHCCCMMTSLKHIPAAHLDKLMVPVDGLRVEVTDHCIGCGTCMETCGFGAISIVNGRAVHSAQCRGCGRCERFCPNHAVRISIDRKQYTQDVEQRIMSYVDISGE